MISAMINAVIFDGESLLDEHAVIIKEGRVEQVLPQSQLPTTVQVGVDLKGNYLTPGFIDLQVNGGGGVLFNSSPTVDAIRAIGEAHRQYGTTGFLPTLITDDFDVMVEAVSAVADALAQGVPGVLGIHLEGPFLNVNKKGTHNAKKFCLIDEQGFDIITSLDIGKTLITIAPELTTPRMIERITDKGVIICAGHSSASYDQVREALTAGVSGFTHLYNAMTPLQSREPGMVGAALEDQASWFGIIADGHHIHPASFRVAISAKHRGGAVLVTDAMPCVGAEDKSFILNGESISAQDGRCFNAEGSLAGSDLDMASAIRNTVKFAGVDWLEAVRMASLYPAQALGLEDELGLIKVGYRANFAALDHKIHVIDTWIDGKRSSHAASKALAY